MPVELMEWVNRLDEEYLAEFIPAGGAAVKIGVAPAEWAASVLESLAGESARRGFLVARVDAAQSKVHMIDQVFYAVAKQVDWDAATERWLRGLLQRNGIVVEAEQSLRDLDAIAAASGRTRSDLFGELHRLVNNSIGQNFALAREFRTAISLLCWGHINPQSVSPSDADVIKQWLLGERCSLATLKKLQIYSRIGRQNARMLLVSLAVWLREVGYAGLALLLDLNAVLMASPPPEHLVRYSRSAVLDVYEVLRQFIDDTDEASCLLVAVVAGPGLVEDPRRNVDNYSALKLRIVDDVRDQDRANPLNAMVRLGALESGAAPS